MNLEITSRQRRPGRRGIGGSDGHFIVSAEKAALMPPWKEERVKADFEKATRKRARDFGSLPQDGKAQLKSRVSHPVSSVVCWLFKLFVFLLSPGSRSRTPTPAAVSGIKTNPAASIADRNFSTVLSLRVPELNSKSIDGDCHACCGRMADGAPVKIGTSQAVPGSGHAVINTEIF